MTLQDKMIVLLSGEGGGVSIGYVEPPDTAEYLLTPDGDVLVSPDGHNVEDI